MKVNEIQIRLSLQYFSICLISCRILEELFSHQASPVRILQEFLEPMALAIDIIFRCLFSRDLHTCRNVMNISRKRLDFSGLECSFRNDLTMLRRPLVTVFYRKTFLSTTLTYLLNTVRPRVYNGTKAFKNSYFNSCLFSLIS